MDDNSSHDGNDSIDWDTDDDLEIAHIPSPPSVSMRIPANAAVTTELAESSSSSSYPSKIVNDFIEMGFPQEIVTKVIRELGESNTDAILDALSTYSASSSSSHPSKIVNDFMKMGFPEAMVTKVIRELGENNADAILDTLFTYSAIDEIPDQENRPNDQNPNPQSNFEIEFSDLDSNFSGEETDESLDKDDPVVSLIDMGYSPEEAAAAVSRCGKDAPLSELVDFITAAHIAKVADAEMDQLDHNNKKRKLLEEKTRIIKKNHIIKPERKRRADDDDVLHLPNPMIGFGVPQESFQVIKRTILKEAVGPPYFFYENVALTPKGVWNTIKNFLYEIEPEFVDSKFFCPAARKRGYIHNLPLNNRFPIQPFPPRTIFEALPESRKWWPSWDTREQLNCILTCVGSAQLTDRLKSAIENCEGEPNPHVIKHVINQCKKWNLVWTGKNRLAPLEPNEIEKIMGYPHNHTRGVSRMERYKGLGNAFQVDTVAYQLSVLKDLYPDGMNVLSLFSGIGGAEVALDKLGIRMNNVVSVEKSSVCRGIIQGWWEQTNQEGNLVHISDVQDVTYARLEEWIRSFGGFDLVIGGSPCNNLAGGNRRTRDGLQGEHSSLFYDYVRILNAVKDIMGRD